MNRLPWAWIVYLKHALFTLIIFCIHWACIVYPEQWLFTWNMNYTTCACIVHLEHEVCTISMYYLPWALISYIEHELTGCLHHELVSMFSRIIACMTYLIGYHYIYSNLHILHEYHLRTVLCYKFHHIYIPVLSACVMLSLVNNTSVVE